MDKPTETAENLEHSRKIFQDPCQQPRYNFLVIVTARCITVSPNTWKDKYRRKQALLYGT